MEIAIDGENAVWVTTMPTLITKALLSFPAKVWWVVVRAYLIPTANDNTLSPLLTSLVACLMVGYPGESSQPSTEAPSPSASASHAPGTYATIPMIFLEKLVADQHQTRTLVDQIVNRMPQDGWFGEPCAVDSVDNEEFKAQLAEMQTQVVKLAEKPVKVPTLVMLESLMPLINKAPSTQSLDEFWGKLPKSKSGKRKHKAGEFDEEIPADLSRKGRRQENKTRKASRKASREKEALEQQQ
uniref:Uncharacterized protein n=1 Tax=Solanum tuberosum TaxID=4113 RepID=M1DAI0_SOLTU